MSAEPNQFQGFSELLNNQRQSLHFSIASCSLVPLLGRDCLLLCICTAASFAVCHPIGSSEPVWWYFGEPSLAGQSARHLPSCPPVCSTWGWNTGKCIWVGHTCDAKCIWQLLWHWQRTAPGFLVIYNSASDWTQLLLVRDLFAITN